MRGSNLSKGQLQRLAIARVVLGNPALLLEDIKIARFCPSGLLISTRSLYPPSTVALDQRRALLKPISVKRA